MPLARLDVVALRRWVVTARADLAAHAATLDRLNVYPVPDGDTGTNLLLTMDQALHTLAEEAPTDLAPAAETLARATLVAARGNSGVILSQLVRGVAQVVVELDRATLDGADLAAVLRRASDLARRGVGEPVEGTMLTVAEAAATGAQEAVAHGGDLAAVADAAVTAATVALIATREQLEVLRRAGVVDAGGAGYLVVIEALQRVVHGSAAAGADPLPEWLRISAAPSCPPHGEPGSAVAETGGPAYEVMYLLDDTDDDRVGTLQATLGALGNSLVVGGGPQLYSVHVHVDDVAAALNAGEVAGHPHRFSVTRFADDADASPAATVPGVEVATVVLAEGAGFVEVVRGEGALVPDAAGDGLPSVADYVTLVERSGASSVVLLAASRDAARIAMEVARLLERAGRQVAVPRCHHPAHVLAALAMNPAEADLPERMDTIRRAVQEVRAASVTWADAPQHGAPVVGEMAGEDAVEGDDVVQVAMQLTERMLADGGELVTLVAGRGLEDDALTRIRTGLIEAHDALEVTAIAGGGIGAALSIGVE